MSCEKTDQAVREVATQAIGHPRQGLTIGHLIASLGAQPKRPELVFEVFLHCLTLYFVDRGRSVTSA